MRQNTLLKDQLAIPSPTPDPTITPTPIPVSEDELWQIVNNWKDGHSGYRYKKLPIVCDYADKRLDQIRTDFGHDGFYQTAKNWAHNNNFKLVAENLSSDINSKDDILTSWVTSSSHYENLNNNFVYSCIRCTVVNHNSLCVQIFANY